MAELRSIVAEMVSYRECPLQGDDIVTSSASFC
jgi:hypothetical protein